MIHSSKPRRLHARSSPFGGCGWGRLWLQLLIATGRDSTPCCIQLVAIDIRLGCGCAAAVAEELLRITAGSGSMCLYLGLV